MSDDADLVLAARDGQRDAFATLVDRWFDRCWEVAWRILHDRDLAADVAQDTLLVAWRRLGELDRPASFGGWVLRIARNRALDRLKRERRARPTDDAAQLEPDMRTRPDAGPEAAVARGQQRDMVWAAAAALGERDASMLDLHLRHGLEPAELADELGIAPNAAHQALFRLRQRLGTAIRAWLLWRNADPSCAVLRRELAGAGDETFGPATVRLVKRHVKQCATCEDEQSRVATPAMLFSVVPLVAAPTAARAHVLQQLAAAGVPVPDPGGSTGGDGDSGSGDAAGRGGTGRRGPEARTAGAGGAVTRALRRPVVLAALVLVLVLSAGGWAWSRGRAHPAVPAGAVTAPTVAPTPSDVVGAGGPSATPAAPGAGVDDDPVTSGTPEDPAPDTGPSEVPSDRPDAPAPRISLFRILHTGRCAAGGPQFELLWDAQDATGASLSGPTGTGQVAVSGTAVRCAPGGSSFVLTVTGPGGSASATATGTVPDVPPGDDVQPGDDPPPDPPPEDPTLQVVPLEPRDALPQGDTDPPPDPSAPN